MPKLTKEGIHLFGDRRKLPLKPEELIKKILSGERDFSYTSLKPGCDLSKYDSYNEMNSYLAKQDLAKEPIILSGSQFPGIIAPGLYVPHVKAECVYFGTAALIGANVAHGNFYGSHFDEGSKLYNLYAASANFEAADIWADLWCANLAYAVLSCANLRKSFFVKTNLFKTRLSGANLMGVMQLEEAENAHTADFMGAKVSHKLRDYLARVLDRETTVIIEAEQTIGKKS